MRFFVIFRVPRRFFGSSACNARVLRLRDWPIMERGCYLTKQLTLPHPGTCVLASFSPRKRVYTSNLVDANERRSEYLSCQLVFNALQKSIVLLAESIVEECRVSRSRIPRALSPHLTIQLQRNQLSRNVERLRPRAFADAREPSPPYGGKE